MKIEPIYQNNNKSVTPEDKIRALFIAMRSVYIKTFWSLAYGLAFLVFLIMSFVFLNTTIWSFTAVFLVCYLAFQVTVFLDIKDYTKSLLIAKKEAQNELGKTLLFDKQKTKEVKIRQFLFFNYFCPGIILVFYKEFKTDFINVYHANSNVSLEEKKAHKNKYLSEMKAREDHDQMVQNLREQRDKKDKNNLQSKNS